MSKGDRGTGIMLVLGFIGLLLWAKKRKVMPESEPEPDQKVEEQTQRNAYNAIYAPQSRRGQWLTIPGRWISTLSFYLSGKSGATGDITFTIRRRADDTIIASKILGDASGLELAKFNWYKVYFDTPVFVDDEVRILCEYEGEEPIFIGIMNADVKPNEGRTIGLPQRVWRDFNVDCCYRYTYTE